LVLIGWNSYGTEGAQWVWWQTFGWPTGQKQLEQPTDFDYGERQSTVEDPWQHRWTLSETLRDVVPEKWGGITVAAAAGSAM
jgi:hypothetical protein